MINFSLRSEFEKWMSDYKNHFDERADIKISTVFEELNNDQREKGVLNFKHKLLIMQIEVWGHGYIDASLLETKNKDLQVYNNNFSTKKEFIHCISSFWKIMLINIEQAESRNKIERAKSAIKIFEAKLQNKKDGPKN